MLAREVLRGTVRKRVGRNNWPAQTPARSMLASGATAAVGVKL